MINLEKSLIPKPQKLIEYGVGVKIAEFNTPMFTIEAEGSDVRVSEGVALIRQKLADVAVVDTEGGEYKIKLTVDAKNEKFKNIDKAEAYFIDVTEKEAFLCGKDAAGAFYAAITFCDMIYLDGDDVFVAKAEIVDWPDFMRRGHFIECRYGTEFLTLKNWCDFIDYLAKMKVNTLTIGVYGCWEWQYDTRRMEYLYVPIKKYPELVTPKNIKYYSVREGKWVHKDNVIPYMYAEDFLGDVIAYAKRKNILVKPLFNSLGHNTLIPRMIPETSAKKEDGTPTNFGFCTNNPRTYEVMFDIYDEIIDRYLLPNEVYDIQIGLDEVGSRYICHCEKCRDKTHAELMVEYIIKICKHLKSRGMKHIYIYHDMLYHHFNIVNEELRDRFIAEGIYDEVVLDWWSYDDPKNLFWGKADGVNNLFHSVIKPDTGYYNWVIPTENNENIRACAKKAMELSFEGMETYSSLEYCYDKNYLTLADVAWNNSGIDDRAEFDERYAYRNYPNNSAKALNVFEELFEAMRDETRENYLNRVCHRFEYYFYCYRSRDTLEIKDFPGGAYKLLKDKEETFLPYLEYLKEKAMPAVEFFKNSGNSSQLNDVWLLISTHYYCIADEYLTIYGLYKSYNKGLADEFEVIRELERLVAQRERLMLLAEKVRIPANSYTYLRNMTVFRQVMLDLLRYFKNEVKGGRKPKLDVTDWKYVQSRAVDFLR